MSTTIEALSLLKGLSQDQWLSVDVKTKVISAQKCGWFTNRSPGKDGEIVQKVVLEALKRFDEGEADVAIALQDVVPALERRKVRALTINDIKEHDLYHNLKRMVKEKLPDAHTGSLVPAVGGRRQSSGPLRLNRVKETIRTVKLCFSPAGGAQASLLSELISRVDTQPAHVPDPKVYKPKTIAAPTKNRKFGSPPKEEELLAALSRMSLKRNGDAYTPYEDECSRLAMIETGDV